MSSDTKNHINLLSESVNVNFKFNPFHEKTVKYRNKVVEKLISP